MIRSNFCKFPEPDARSPSPISRTGSTLASECPSSKKPRVGKTADCQLEKLGARQQHEDDNDDIKWCVAQMREDRSLIAIVKGSIKRKTQRKYKVIRKSISWMGELPYYVVWREMAILTKTDEGTWKSMEDQEDVRQALIFALGVTAWGTKLHKKECPLEEFDNWCAWRYEQNGNLLSFIDIYTLAIDWNFSLGWFLLQKQDVHEDGRIRSIRDTSDGTIMLLPARMKIFIGDIGVKFGIDRNYEYWEATLMNYHTQVSTPLAAAKDRWQALLAMQSNSYA